jgi:hypothetical protein
MQVGVLAYRAFVFCVCVCVSLCFLCNFVFVCLHLFFEVPVGGGRGGGSRIDATMQGGVLSHQIRFRTPPLSRGAESGTLVRESAEVPSLGLWCESSQPRCRVWDFGAKVGPRCRVWDFGARVVSRGAESGTLVRE